MLTYISSTTRKSTSWPTSSSHAALSLFGTGPVIVMQRSENCDIHT